MCVIQCVIVLGLIEEHQVDVGHYPEQRALSEDSLPKSFDSKPIKRITMKMKLRLSIVSTVLHDREEADTHRFDDSSCGRLT